MYTKSIKQLERENELLKEILEQSTKNLRLSEQIREKSREIRMFLATGKIFRHKVNK